MPTTETTRAKRASGIKKKTAIANTKPGGTKKAKSSNYNKYMTDKLAELKAANPEQEYKDRVKAVAEAWKKDRKGK